MRENFAPSFSALTSLHLGGTALAELILEDLTDLEILPDRLRALGGEPFILGRGTNILAQDGELPLVLIRPELKTAPEIVGEDGEKVFVRAGCAVTLPSLLRFCATHSLSGLEGLTGIPGSVGGSIAMNAGSFGTETCANLYNVQIFMEQKIKTLGIDAFRYGYRKFYLPNVKDFLILGATFSLTKDVKNDILTRMRLNFLKKKSRQPLTEWSAGCVFKNPSPELSAGKILDLCGFKGKSMGCMAFSKKHANFLINTGRGCAVAAFDLLQQAKESAKKIFNCDLEPEVRIIQRSPNGF